MSRTHITKSIASVRTTLAIEGLNMSDESIQTSYDFLKGKISSPEAIDKIKKYIIRKNR